MDSLDFRLVELNDALLRVTKGFPIDSKLLRNAELVLAGDRVNGGCGDDTIIINHNENIATELVAKSVPGSQGPPGPKGDQGPPGISESLNKKTIVIDDDYIVLADDFYIGVNSDHSVKILLQNGIEDGTRYVIKGEMAPPLGDRKITIIANENELIDDSNSITIQRAFGSINLIRRDGNWYIVSYF